MLLLALITTLLLTAYPIHALVAIRANRAAARPLRLPILTAPVPVTYPLWYSCSLFLAPLLARLLPAPLAVWTRCSTVGWPFREGWAVHADVWAAAVAAQGVGGDNEQEQGQEEAKEEEWREKRERKRDGDGKVRLRGKEEMAGCFCYVHVGGWELVLCDDVAVSEVLRRRDVFVKPHELYGTLDVFGRNVDTLNGEEWARHRKITAPCFNERVSALVWDESARQARSMLCDWYSKATTSPISPPSSKPSRPRAIVSTMIDDTRVIALHVLSAAGFGVKQEFAGGMRQVAPGSGHRMTYRDALMTVLSHLVLIFALPVGVLLSPVMPKGMRAVGVAMQEFRAYMEEMLEGERTAIAESSSGGASKDATGRLHERHNLMATLIRSSDEGRSPRDRLTDAEIRGNLFIFNLAGHDTTANSLAFAFALLAVHEEVQAWVGEEVARVLGDEKGGHARYEDAYPRLVRCQAVLSETLRLYGPVVYFPRRTNAPHEIPLSTGASLAVPANTNIVLNSVAVHTSAAWARTGAPAHQFHPQRWIRREGDGGDGDSETFAQPPGTTFLPWATGPRTCPGMKFSQVEFVAVLSAVLLRARVRPAEAEADADASDGVGPAAAERVERSRTRIRAAVADAGFRDGITLGINRKQDVVLEVREIGGEE